MTTASLKPAIPAGGILTQHVESDVVDFETGRPVTQRVIVAVLQVSGTATESQEKGRVKKGKYETVHLVEITDSHEADRLRHLITTTRADRGFAAKQPTLYDATDEEQRESLLDMIRDWASEQNLAMADVDKQWVDYFGGGDYAASETVQASRSVAQLKEFAYHVGVLAETVPAAETDPDEEDDTPAAPAVSFQPEGDE
jgi:hypothetical protein